MSIENDLKILILEKFKSLLEFSKSINIPYSTLDNIFKRGVLNANIENIIKICVALNISADELAKGNITYNATRSYIANNYPAIFEKFYQLNAAGKVKAEAYIDDLLASGNYTDDLAATSDFNRNPSGA